MHSFICLFHEWVHSMKEIWWPEYRTGALVGSQHKEKKVPSHHQGRNARPNGTQLDSFVWNIRIYDSVPYWNVRSRHLCCWNIYKVAFGAVQWVRKQRTNKTLSNWGEPSTKRRFHPALLLDQCWGLEKRNGYGVDAIAWGKSRFNAIGFTWFVGGGGYSTTSCLLVYMPLLKMWYQVLSFDPMRLEVEAKKKSNANESAWLAPILSILDLPHWLQRRLWWWDEQSKAQ
jgi:hypothetical protein